MLEKLNLMIEKTLSLLKRPEIQNSPNLRIPLAVFVNMLNVRKIQVMTALVKFGDFILE